MYLRKKYIQLKKYIYRKKLINLLNSYNIYDSINLKTEKILNKIYFEKNRDRNDMFPVEISKYIISNIIETVLFSEFTNKEITFSKGTLNFIISYEIDKLLFDNINLFYDDIKFLKKYKIINDKLTNIY